MAQLVLFAFVTVFTFTWSSLLGPLVGQPRLQLGQFIPRASDGTRTEHNPCLRQGSGVGWGGWVSGCDSKGIEYLLYISIVITLEPPNSNKE